MARRNQYIKREVIKRFSSVWNNWRHAPFFSFPRSWTIGTWTWRPTFPWRPRRLPPVRVATRFPEISSVRSRIWWRRRTSATTSIRSFSSSIIIITCSAHYEVHYFLVFPGISVFFCRDTGEWNMKEKDPRIRKWFRNRADTYHHSWFCNDF